ncbi:hypothetical protein V8C86DRAFT_366837 [Haematococcus lacustris]
MLAWAITRLNHFTSPGFMALAAQHWQHQGDQAVSPGSMVCLCWAASRSALTMVLNAAFRATEGEKLQPLAGKRGRGVGKGGPTALPSPSTPPAVQGPDASSPGPVGGGRGASLGPSRTAGGVGRAGKAVSVDGFDVSGVGSTPAKGVSMGMLAELADLQSGGAGDVIPEPYRQIGRMAFSRIMDLLLSHHEASDAEGGRGGSQGQWGYSSGMGRGEEGGSSRGQHQLPDNPSPGPRSNSNGWAGGPDSSSRASRGGPGWEGGRQGGDPAEPHAPAAQHARQHGPAKLGGKAAHPIAGYSGQELTAVLVSATRLQVAQRPELQQLAPALMAHCHMDAPLTHSKFDDLQHTSSMRSIHASAPAMSKASSSGGNSRSSSSFSPVGGSGLRSRRAAADPLHFTLSEQLCLLASYCLLGEDESPLVAHIASNFAAAALRTADFYAPSSTNREERSHVSSRGGRNGSSGRDPAAASGGLNASGQPSPSSSFPTASASSSSPPAVLNLTFISDACWALTLRPQEDQALDCALATAIAALLPSPAAQAPPPPLSHSSSSSSSTSSSSSSSSSSSGVLCRDGVWLQPDVLACLVQHLPCGPHVLAHEPGLAHALVASAQALLPSCPPRKLADLSQSFAMATIYSPELCNALAEHLLDCGDHCTLEILRDVMAALAGLNHYHAPLFKVGVKRLVDALPSDQVSVRTAATILWACAVVQHPDLDSRDVLFKHMWAQGQPENWPDISVCQVYFAYLMATLQHYQHKQTPSPQQQPASNATLPPASPSPTSGRLPPPLPAEYLPKYFNTYIHTRSGGNHISNMQRDVFRTLQALGTEPQMEVPIMQGLFVVDIMAQWRGRQVVVEVDGPMHFSSNAPRHPLCSTVARDRCLLDLGRNLLCVHWLDWKHVTASAPAHDALRQQQAQMAFLHAQLDRAIAV